MEHQQSTSFRWNAAGKDHPKIDKEKSGLVILTQDFRYIEPCLERLSPQTPKCNVGGRAQTVIQIESKIPHKKTLIGWYLINLPEFMSSGASYHEQSLQQKTTKVGRDLMSSQKTRLVYSFVTVCILYLLLFSSIYFQLHFCTPDDWFFF